MSIARLLSSFSLNSPNPQELLVGLACGVVLWFALLAMIDYLAGRKA